MQFVSGNGSEQSPFWADDGTAGIGTQIRQKTRGGCVDLPGGRYDITRSIVVDMSSMKLDGGVWSCNTDPNGVFEARHGTKIRMHGTDYAAIRVGDACDPISGAEVCNLGIQGDITGMDTRKLVDFAAPEKAAGLCLDRVRTDQCAFVKLSFCGLANAVCVAGNAEVDACRFERINTDGCGNGFYFAPRASYYAQIHSCVVADNPYYGVYACGRGRQLHNLQITDTHFVRNGGAFCEDDGHLPAAVLLDEVSHCEVSRCLFDAPGTFWYYADEAKQNNERQPQCRKTVALHVIGHENRIRDNTFLHSSDDAIRIEGNGNVLMNTISDGNVRITGKGSQVLNLAFTRPEARLILQGDAVQSTYITGIAADRIIQET